MTRLSPEEYAKTITTVGVVVACLVCREDKYLLVQEAQEHVYGLWNLPAGHVDKDEELESAAIRETKEETGLDVMLDGEVALYHESAAKSIKHVYAAHVVGGEETPQRGEILQVAWLTYDEVTALNEQGKLRAPWVWDVIDKAEGAR